jgi:hypothetical protein
MTLEEALDEQTFVNHDEAIAEVEDHHVPVQEFYADLGVHRVYRARDVLVWLGY